MIGVVYADIETGAYLGDYVGRHSPPSNAVVVPYAPEDARQIWNGEVWLPVPITAADIAERRWRVETAGLTVDGLAIATDDRSKLLINGAAVEAMLDPSYQMQWKTPAGFVELTASQVLAVARAVRAHVQACFDREAELLAQLDAGTFESGMLDEGWPE